MLKHGMKKYRIADLHDLIPLNNSMSVSLKMRSTDAMKSNISGKPGLPLSVKGKVFLQFFTDIFTVIRKESREKEVASKRWQIGSLVTCVPRHLQLKVTFSNTGRPTVEARDTTVLSATSHLPKMVI